MNMDERFSLEHQYSNSSILNRSLGIKPHPFLADLARMSDRGVEIVIERQLEFVVVWKKFN